MTGSDSKAAAAGAAVLVVQRRMTHYRVPFFESLRRKMGEAGLELVLAYGNGTEAEESKKDGADIDWAVRLPTRYFLDGRVCWQPFHALARRCALTVVTAENKLLWNLADQYGRRAHRVALWGHGGNLQGDRTSWRERFKRRVAREADWWFAYTAMSVPLIEQSGFPHDRITVLENAVDTSEMRDSYQAITDSRRREVRQSLNLSPGPLGIFVGSLYEEKRLPFLLDALGAIRQRIPGFQFLVIGSGPQESLVRQFCLEHPWVRYLGPQKGRQKIELLSIADIMLNPGLVGLGILDSFVCEVPMVTTDCGLHSPEIAYLSSGKNGLMVEDCMDAYVEAVERLLAQPAALAALKEGCRASARHYTVDNMAGNFVRGAVSALAMPAYR